MSASANWSYTAKATFWALMAQDDWSRVKTYGPPVVIDCDYSAEAKQLRDDKGVEFTSRQLVFTEHASIKTGDMLVIGLSEEATPPASAFEVRLITRNADVFDRVADDYRIAT